MNREKKWGAPLLDSHIKKDESRESLLTISRMIRRSIKVRFLVYGCSRYLEGSFAVPLP